MANLELSITTEAVVASLGDLQARIDNPKELYELWANELDGIIQDAFDQETAPDGQPWAELSTARAAAKVAAGLRGKILQAEGDLRRSAQAQVTTDGVIAATNQQVGEYELGAIQHFGAPRANIPARRILPLDERAVILPETFEVLKEIAQDYLLG